MSEPMIRLQNISKSYDGGRTYAVQDLNLAIDKGDFIALLGPSGCGKSTTLMMLCGLYRPTSGDIFFHGRRVNDVLPKDRNIGMVFQSYALYPSMNVFENIAFPLKQLKTLNKHQIREKVQQVAEIVKIPELLKRMPAQLSGGQQQRVAMCRALAKNPDILLLDEPMSNLDARLKLEIRDEIKKLQKQLGLTAIIVTHDQEEALAISTKVAVIDAGSVQQYAAPDDLYARPENLFVASFIGTPPMNFITGHLERRSDGLLCRTPCGDLHLPSGFVDENYENIGEGVTLGIRPHLFELVEDARQAFQFEVDYIEHLGRECLVKSYSEDLSVRILLPARVERDIGRQILVRPRLDGVCVFDNRTRENITTPRKRNGARCTTASSRGG